MVDSEDVTGPEEIEAQVAKEESANGPAAEDRLAKIAATAPGVLYSFRMRPDGSFCIPYASPTIVDIYGIGCDDLAIDARPALGLTHPHDAERFTASIAESARTLSPWRCEFRILNPRTGERWIEGRSTPEREPDGGTLWHGFLTDVTDRRRTEDALRASEERHRSLFDNMREGLAYCEMVVENGEPVDFIYHEVNRAFEELTGLENVTGKRVTELIPAVRASNPDLFRIYGRVAATGEPTAFESYVEALGTWFQVSAYSPKKGYFTALFTDVTDRKRELEALRESEARYRTLVESAPEAALILDVEAEKFVDVNENAERLFGMSRNELLKVSPIRLSPRTQPDGRPSLETALELIGRTLSGERPVVDWTCRNAAGEDIACEVWLTRIPASRFLVRGSVIDVRDKQGLEAQLRHSQKLEAVGRLAGGVAHDFNNLLGVITGYADLAVRQLEPAHPAYSRIEQVRKAADRAAELTRRLLAFSRRQVLQPKVVDLGLLVADLQSMLERVLGEDVVLTARRHAGQSAARVDPGQIEQAIMNLAINARDAMPAGGTLTLEVENVDLDEKAAAVLGAVAPGPYVALSVSDTGLGMDAATQARIFEPFFTTKPTGEGTGLGLAMVYGIVKQSGGTIEVKSDVGQGTSFWIYLPRIQEAATQPMEAKVGGATKGKETLLVVEDQDALREVLVESLESFGYTVLSADGADAAMAVAAAHPGTIDLLLTDVVMPGTGGRALAAHLLAERPGIKVLYMSGYTSDVLGRQGILDHGLELIEKPFTTDKLARKLRELIDRRS
jgi:PAS domain S-box-containing protein